MKIEFIADKTCTIHHFYHISVLYDDIVGGY